MIAGAAVEGSSTAAWPSGWAASFHVADSDVKWLNHPGGSLEAALKLTLLADLAFPLLGICSVKIQALIYTKLYANINNSLVHNYQVNPHAVKKDKQTVKP